MFSWWQETQGEESKTTISMKLRGRGIQIYDIINGLQVKKKKEEYIKLVVIKQNHSKRFANGFITEP